ncbi:MAG: hypothetical protein DWQ07_12360 [Chloroflexi bacterium]|nr:MAG: hypothetical protein DWQ07_12360 [Chloroflexota bacterium]MBL1196832.1 sigma-70 family RNA polymerase sigma factor [Chloroflexota bacterium]NOH14127.1 sigma-70 family RNA polymerase sigma factor [Chloroflexota bacterium]
MNTTTQIPNVELAQQAAKGDQVAYTELFHQYFQAVYNYALSLTSDPAGAEDLTQDAFIKAYNNIHRLGHPWNFRTWIFRMTRNLFVDQLRGQRTITGLDEARQMAENETPLEKQSIRSENADSVRQTLEFLPTQHREALMLREFYAMPYAEIASVMEISQSNVKVVLHRARAKFQEAFGLKLLLDEPTEDCASLHELLTVVHDGEAQENQLSFVQKHLTGCDACKERQKRLVKLTALMGLFTPIIPPAGLAESILGKIEKLAPGPSGPSPQSLLRWTILGAAGLAVLVLVGLGLTNGSTDPIPADQDTMPYSGQGGIQFTTETATAEVLADFFPGFTETPSATASCEYTAKVPLFCRLGPGPIYPWLDTFEEGQSSTVIGRNADGSYLYVLGLSDGQQCTVPNNEEFGSTSGPCDNLPPFTDPLTPTITLTVTPVPTKTPNDDPGTGGGDPSCTPRVTFAGVPIPCP